MAKFIDDSALDALLDIIATSTELYVCNAEPTSRAEAISFSLVDAVVMAPADFIKSDGTVSGRKVTVARKPSITTTSAGTTSYVALTTGADLILVTPCTEATFILGETLTVTSFEAEVNDPS